MAEPSRLDELVRKAFLDALRPTVDGPTTNRLDALLQEWEERRRRGDEIALEDLCRDCPELIEPMRRGLAAVSKMDALIEASATGAISGDSLETIHVDRPVPKAPTEMIGTLPDVEPCVGAEPVPGFRLTRRLGSGGFGSVWEAQASGGFLVAMKFVPLVGDAGESELKSLQVLRRLRHPNLVGTFGAWRSPMRLIIAMELADRTLADRLREAKAQGLPGIPGPELLECMRAAAKGIDYLNQPHPLIEGGAPVRVQHRDIKPANILIVGDGIKVADFGLARVLERTLVTQSGGMTPAYAAPEFFAGQTSRYSDQYSLAASYCELRGGEPPFTGTFAEVVVGHIEKQPNLTLLPEAERQAVARALAKNPEERWPTCAAFVDALARTGNESMKSAPRSAPTSVVQPTPAVPRVARPVRPWVAWVAGILAFVTVAAVVWQLPAIQRMLTRAEPSSPHEKEKAGEWAHLDPGKTIPKDIIQVKEKVPAKVEPAIKPMVKNTPIEKVIPKQKSPVDIPRPGERLRFTKHSPNQVRAAAWVPKTNRVLSADASGDLWLWDVSTGKEVHHFEGHMRPAPNSIAVQTLAVSADGRLAISGGDDTTLRLWDLEKGDVRKVLRKKRIDDGDVDFAIYGVGFYDGARRAVSAGNANQLILWDLDSGAEDGRLETDLSEVLCLAVAPNNSRIVIGGSRGAVRLMDLAPDGQKIRYEGHQDDVLAVAFFADGERFVTAGGGDGPQPGLEDYALRLWKTGEKKPRVLHGHTAKVGCIAVSHDGRRILSGDSTGALRFWDADAGRELPRFDQPAEDDKRGAVTCVCFSPDGNEAISGYTDGTLRVWILPK